MSVASWPSVARSGDSEDLVVAIGEQQIGLRLADGDREVVGVQVGQIVQGELWW